MILLQILEYICLTFPSNSNLPEPPFGGGGFAPRDHLLLGPQDLVLRVLGCLGFSNWTGLGYFCCSQWIGSCLSPFLGSRFTQSSFCPDPTDSLPSFYSTVLLLSLEAIFPFSRLVQQEWQSFPQIEPVVWGVKAAPKGPKARAWALDVSSLQLIIQRWVRQTNTWIP